MEFTGRKVRSRPDRENELMVEHRDASIASDVTASAALLLYSAAVVGGFARVFSGWDFFDNLLLVAVVGHGLGLVLRLLRVPVWVAFPVTGLGLIWLIGAMFYRDTYTLFLPTSETWDLFRLELDLVGEQFRTAVAPVAFLAGWDVLAALGVAAAALLADTFAFRAYARAEALVPGGVLFVFVAALGTDRIRIASTMALVAAGVVATVVLRQHHSPARTSTIGISRLDLGRVIPVAIGSALSVALIAGFAGPRLPGAGEDPIYETKGGSRGSVTEVVSPLVDIRSRLTNRSTTELFTVQADTDSYWRSSALPKFDGVTWGLPERALSRADGTIGQGVAGAVEIRQEVTIAALGGALLPAAADPVAATGEGDLRNDLRWNADSATLVKTGGDLETGNRFSIISASPRYSSTTLATATSLDPGDPIYLELPSDFPDSVAVTAREVTAGSTSTYAAALSLQDWMRNEFTYSLEIQEGHGNNAIESFLVNRVGYCEQFAGTYAAMLRSIDIPARVAVGFTQGTGDGAGGYSVLGRNAHAWPEVWFDDIGWVPFEPTPGRGAPGAQEYTGVAPQQDEGPAGGDEAVEGDAPPITVGAPETTLVDGAGVPIPTTIPAAPAPGAGPANGSAEPVESIGGGFSAPWRLLVALALVGLVVAAPAAIRRIRRSSITSPTAQLAHLWTRATGALRSMGLDESPDRTPGETAAATASVFPVASRPMQSLADIVTYVNYSPDGSAHLGDEGSYGITTLENCRIWVRQVERAVTDSLTPVERARRYFTQLS
jgi:transglutaminase-like putative cysteine protease